MPTRTPSQRQRPRRTPAWRLRAAGENGATNGREPGPYDRKLGDILRRAAEVFCERGYHHASVRDIARATRVSLAGLYYYFSSKEELLYLIQRHAFETLLRSAREALEPVGPVGRLRNPEERLRTFIRLHLQFFLEHPNEMKVLTHEEEWLEDARRREIRSIKKAYYRLCMDQVEALRRARGLKNLNTRLAVLSLFGMMNWIYTWYNPKVDPGAAACAERMHGIFLNGILGQRSAAGGRAKARTMDRAPGSGDKGVQANGRSHGPNGGQNQRAGDFVGAERATSHSSRLQRSSH
ncbi:MAG TPA: TetR/AcrR family transcriptional regulator [Terriglobia bacterium]|nr:TetR/AcrR family transcriptional regulator [Terriglobia bacterium]